MVESACKWLIQQRFKGVGMRWSEDGLTICCICVGMVNRRFDTLFSDEPLVQLCTPQPLGAPHSTKMNRDWIARAQFSR